MIDRLRKLLSTPQAGAPGRHSDEDLRLAAAVLLVEAAQMDENYDVAERRAIAGAVKRQYGLDELETASLLEIAERAQESANELSRFAKKLKDHYSPQERVELIEMLWEVVYADGELHPYEANLMRRIGGLLYVPDRERGEARKRVMQRLGREA